MPVVSVSLPDVLVQQMDVAVAREGAKGRSAFVRAAIRKRFKFFGFSVLDDLVEVFSAEAVFC